MGTGTHAHPEQTGRTVQKEKLFAGMRIAMSIHTEAMMKLETLGMGIERLSRAQRIELGQEME